MKLIQGASFEPVATANLSLESPGQDLAADVHATPQRITRAQSRRDNINISGIPDAVITVANRHNENQGLAGGLRLAPLGRSKKDWTDTISHQIREPS